MLITALLIRKIQKSIVILGITVIMARLKNLWLNWLWLWYLVVVLNWILNLLGNGIYILLLKFLLLRGFLLNLNLWDLLFI